MSESRVIRDLDLVTADFDGVADDWASRRGVSTDQGGKANATVLGVVPEATNMGETSGTLLSNDGTAKQWFEEIEDSLEDLIDTVAAGLPDPTPLLESIAESVAQAEDYSGQTLLAKNEVNTVKTQIDAIDSEIDSKRIEIFGYTTSAALSRDQALESALQAEIKYKSTLAASAVAGGDYFPAARDHVPQGVPKGSVTVVAPGSGGTNGTYALGFSSGNFAVNPTGSFTVSGGVVTSISITGTGYYVGSAISTPTPTFTNCPGLSGASATLTSVYLKTAGELYYTDHASDIRSLSQFQNQGNAATLVKATVSWLNFGYIDSQVDRVSSINPKIDKSYRLAETALASGYEQVCRVVGTNNENAVWARWAKFFDAGSVNDDFTVMVGEVIDAAFIDSAILNGVGDKIRCRITQRAMTSDFLNSPPGASGDLIVSDTGLTDIPVGWPDLTGSTLTAFPYLPIPSFTVLAGYTYCVEIWWEDGAGGLLATIVKRKTITTSAQRHAGFYYAAVDAVDWTNQTVTRTFAFGLGRRKLKNFSDVERAANRLVPASPFTSALSEMERTMLTERGAWDRLTRPLLPTHNHGLARLGFKGGVKGIDFGPRVSEDSMTDLKTFPQWNGTDRLTLAGANVNSPDGYVFEKGKLIGGFFNINAANVLPIHMSDILIRNGYAAGISSGIAQAQPTADIYVDHSLIEQNYTAGISFKQGEVKNSIIQMNGQNGCTILHDDTMSTASVVFENNFIGYSGALAAGLVDPHGDLIEANWCYGLSVCGCTLWLPFDGATGTDPSNTVDYPFWELTGNQVNCIRQSVSTPGAVSQESYVLGVVFAGANPAMTLRVWKDGSTLKNVVRAFNRYANAGYRSSLPPLRLRGADDGNGIWENICIFDEYFFDGTPIDISTGEAIPASYLTRIASPNPYRPHEERWGVFDWVKASASQKLFEVLHLLGNATGRTILDSNNDLNPDYDLGNLLTYTGTLGGAE